MLGQLTRRLRTLATFCEALDTIESREAALVARIVALEAQVADNFETTRYICNATGYVVDADLKDTGHTVVPLYHESRWRRENGISPDTN